MEFRVDINAQKNELDKLRKICLDADKEQKRKEAQLELFDFDGWGKFRDEVLFAELNRIAHARMTYQAEDRYLHERMQGEYNECKLLLARKEDLETEVKLGRKRIEGLNVKINELEKKINKKLKGAN